MKTLITGATGFIGQHLVKRALADEGVVRILVRKKESCRFKPDKRLEVFCGDLAIRESLKNLTGEIDVVINAAGLMGKWGGTQDQLHKINVLGVENLLDACSRSNIKHFIHISTCGVSGPLDYDGADESYNSMPSTPYTKTKLLGENTALQFGLKKNIPVTVIRPTFTYGPSDLHRLSLYKVIKKGHFVLIGKGEGTLHPVYIDDLVEGIMLCKKQKPCSNIFIIGGEKVTTIKELAASISDSLHVKRPNIQVSYDLAKICASGLEKAGRILGFEPPLTKSRFDLFTQHHGYSISKAKKELGYRPQVALDDGLARTVRWYIQCGYL